MNLQTFRDHYRGLSDAELSQILDDTQDLLPEAGRALDDEVRRRNLSLDEMALSPWQPVSGEQVDSLEQYEPYRQLLERRRFVRRYIYIIALGPLILGLALGRFFRTTFLENSTIFVVISLGWAMALAAYGVLVNIRFLAFKCPQCLHRFGARDEGFVCGFPRSTRHQ
jgi:hypothetical protein